MPFNELEADKSRPAPTISQKELRLTKNKMKCRFSREGDER
jgi:hypothetical protein